MNQTDRARALAAALNAQTAPAPTPRPRVRAIATRVALALAGASLLLTGHGLAHAHADTAPRPLSAKHAVATPSPADVAHDRALVARLDRALTPTVNAQTNAACAHVTDPQEDEPCWSWSTRGNLARGIVTRAEGATPRHHRVVDACAFARAVRAQTIDWTRTEHVRGDVYAMRHGCDPRYYAQDAR